jgi:hypothetical protein
MKLLFQSKTDLVLGLFIVSLACFCVVMGLYEFATQIMPSMLNDLADLTTKFVHFI